MASGIGASTERAAFGREPASQAALRRHLRSAARPKPDIGQLFQRVLSAPTDRPRPEPAALARRAVSMADGIRWRSDPTTSRCRKPAVAARHPAAGIHYLSGPTTGQP